MAAELPELLLFDFLYRDSNRINSYSAQLFGSLLAGTQETDTLTRGEERSTKVGAAVAAHEQRASEQVGEGTIRSTNPHDAAVLAVLNVLISTDSIQEDIYTAPHGSLVIAVGTLVLVDKTIIELASVAADAAVQQEMGKPKAQRNQQTIANSTLIAKFLESAAIPSSFLLRTAFGAEIVGTIKDAGLEEPISTYYFKHGTASLSDITLIGIKEVPSPSFTLPDTHLLGLGQAVAQSLSDMVFPADAMRVTPLAIYRRIKTEPSGSEELSQATGTGA